jgi:hypothetical protein
VLGYGLASKDGWPPAPVESSDGRLLRRNEEGRRGGAGTAGQQWREGIRAGAVAIDKKEKEKERNKGRKSVWGHLVRGRRQDLRRQDLRR